jgi:predicted nucleotidyltransferase
MLTSELRSVAQKRGVRNLRVFGSSTRDPECARDLDLLVDLASDRTLLDLVAFRREAEALLAVPVDVATADMLKERIRARVLAEARPL